MDAVFCKNGHSYDPAKHATCPFCGVQVDIGATKPHADGGTVELNAESPGQNAARQGETRAEGAQPQRPPARMAKPSTSGRSGSAASTR